MAGTERGGAQDEVFSEWAVVELMGHRRLAGRVTEQQLAGAAFLRLDIPESDHAPAATQFYAPGAVYCITPVGEEIARQLAAALRPTPVHRWELPALGARPASDGDEGDLA